MIRVLRSIRSVSLFICLAGLACLVLTSCGGQWNVPESAKEVKNPIQPTAETLAYAHHVYEDHCAHCHGVNGDGKRPPGTTYFYLTQPTNFTDAKIMDAMTDGEIFWKISTGNRPMPSYKGQLSESDRWELVSFLRTFAHPPGPSAQSGPTAPH